MGLSGDRLANFRMYAVIIYSRQHCGRGKIDAEFSIALEENHVSKASRPIWQQLKSLLK